MRNDPFQQRKLEQPNRIKEQSPFQTNPEFSHFLTLSYKPFLTLSSSGKSLPRASTERLHSLLLVPENEHPNS